MSLQEDLSLPSPATLSSTEPVGIIARLVRRPVAVSMFFLATVLLGIFAWARIPVELLPSVTGDSLFVQMSRPGAEPQVIEQEMMLPLEKRIAQLSGITQQSGRIQGSEGTLTITLSRHTDYRIRELELRQIAADIAKTQPDDARIRVSNQDTSALSRFVLNIQAVSELDIAVLRDIIEQRVQPGLESLPGVSQVMVFGGANQDITVGLNPQLSAEFGLTIPEVVSALEQRLTPAAFVGSVQNNDQRSAVLFNANAAANTDPIAALGDIRILPDKPVLLRHVAHIQAGPAPQTSISRVNGKASVSLMVFQEEQANLIELGNAVQSRIGKLNEKLAGYGIQLFASFSAAEVVEAQLQQLQSLALAGVGIALLVLYLFLRQIRAVYVIAIALPTSLLAAGAALYLYGLSLNLITLFGLVIGIGMLVDNSIVVFEAVQRALDKGATPEQASVRGTRITARAIIAASATNVIVFVPLLFSEDIPVAVAGMLENIVPAILFPLLASLLVALALVPMLTSQLLRRNETPSSAASPALVPQQQPRQPRQHGQPRQPYLLRDVLSGFAKVIMRRPTLWLFAIIAAIVATVLVALPWVLVDTITQANNDPKRVRMEVTFDSKGTLSAASDAFRSLENAASNVPGVAWVESYFDAERGVLTAHLSTENSDSLSSEENKDSQADAPSHGGAPAVRRSVKTALSSMNNVQLTPLSSVGNNNQDPALTGEGMLTVSVSGPQMQPLHVLAQHIKQKLQATAYVDQVNIDIEPGRAELPVSVSTLGLLSHQLMPERVFETLMGVGIEGFQTGKFYSSSGSAAHSPSNNGRPIPVMLRQRPDEQLSAGFTRIDALPLASEQAVLFLHELTHASVPVTPMSVSRENGRRELQIHYSLDSAAPANGPARVAIDNAIAKALNSTYLPPGYSITQQQDNSSHSWLLPSLVPVLLLLYALLAITFESLTLPFLVLLAAPLTLLGAIWALFFTGLGISPMAAIGVVVLLGLTVNPAILLIDRMQQKYQRGVSAGQAAIGALRERIRPVMMTVCTTVAGLWPLALSSSEGAQIWPPFATVIIGGLLSSTLLTLLVIPASFVLLQKLSAAIAKRAQQINTEADVLTENSAPISLEVRYLTKIYHRAGPVKKAWQRWRDFTPFPAFAQAFVIQRLQLLAISVVAALALIWSLGWGLSGSDVAASQTATVWFIAACFICGGLLSAVAVQFHHLKSLRSEHQAQPLVKTSTFPRLITLITPWLVLLLLTFGNRVFASFPALSNGALLIAVMAIAIWQLAQAQRAKALGNNVDLTDADTNSGANSETNSNTNSAGKLAALKQSWQKLSTQLLTLGSANREFRALAGINFTVAAGMTGVLGGNGAGKTTLFRLLANILTPSLGRIYYAGTEQSQLRHVLADLIGYLPQSFGLPNHLTGREYLHYFALLYGVGNESGVDIVRRAANTGNQILEQRINELLAEVGLTDKQHEKIGSYSGGMRQRIAIARTLLKAPKIIIVDEPTAGLDPRERVRFRNLLSRLATQRVVLFSTHVLEDVAVSCSRVLVLNSGEIVFDGNPGDMANLARDNVWQVQLPMGDSMAFEKQHNVINQTPGANHTMIMRVLAAQPPHSNAEPIAPTLEDGYFQLFKKVKKP